MATKDEILESIANMTVLEIADLVKAMEEKFGVSAAAVAAPVAGGAAAAAPAEEEKTEFDVILAAVPADKKIPCIKVVRELTGLGLSSIESRSCDFISRFSTVPVISIIRSARVDLPWSMCAMMQKFRILSVFIICYYIIICAS